MIALRFALSIIQSPYQNPAKNKGAAAQCRRTRSLTKWVLITMLMRSE
jgi:hypothetical protein